MQIPKNISLLALGMAAAYGRSIINHGRRWSVRWIPFGGLLCSSTEEGGLLRETASCREKLAEKE